MTFKQFLFTSSILLSFFSAQAATDKNTTDAEIQYLLSYIAQSECVFNRNGTEYDSQQARQHIERKYNYFKSDLTSAEDFISRAASKSSFSGKAYTINCGNQQMTSEQWLIRALEKYRSAD